MMHQTADELELNFYIGNSLVANILETTLQDTYKGG